MRWVEGVGVIDIRRTCSSASHACHASCIDLSLSTSRASPCLPCVPLSSSCPPHSPSCSHQDIPSIIEAAEAERAQRLQLQAKMREAKGADKGLVLYLQVGGWKRGWAGCTMRSAVQCLKQDRHSQNMWHVCRFTFLSVQPSCQVWHIALALAAFDVTTATHHRSLRFSPFLPSPTGPGRAREGDQ